MSDLGYSDLGLNLSSLLDEFYGEESFDQVWIFETALDERVCPLCGPLEGEAFLIEDLEASFPNARDLGDGTIAANLHKNCRCVLVEVEEYEGE